MTLHLAPKLDLTDDFVTKTIGILAQRRKGKTYTANVIAEEMVTAGIPWVALDPTGAWWGLRASADGKKDGLPVTILGGQHGDIPLERTAGKELANFVVDEPGWYIFDLSLFESKAADRQFATDFAERLYRRKGQPGGDAPLHLFVDEADIFVPQRPGTDGTTMLGAYETLVRRGGLRGLGTTLISQRSAVVNKNVLEQLDMLVVLRTVGPNDRERIKDIVSAAGTKDQVTELLDSLASLELGEAWFWEPGEALFERHQVRERRTFNSSATPKTGETRAEPRRLAAIDLDALKDRMAATIERAKADDPAILKARIRDLEHDLRDARASTPEPERIIETVEIPVLTDEDRAAVAELMGRLETVLGVLQDVEGVARDLVAKVDAARTPPTSHNPGVTSPSRGHHAARAPHIPAPAPAERRTPPPARTASAPDDGYQPRAGARRMLDALASWPNGLTDSQLGTLAKVKKTGGTFGTYTSELRRNGLIDRHGDLWIPTDAGLDLVGGARPPADPAEARAYWRSKFTGGARRMYDLLVDTYPQGLTADELADRADITRTGGTFGTYVSRLRSNGCLREVDGEYFAHPDLFMEAIR